MEYNYPPSKANPLQEKQHTFIRKEEPDPPKFPLSIARSPDPEPEPGNTARTTRGLFSTLAR
jgi:hypothetical protein